MVHGMVKGQHFIAGGGERMARTLRRNLVLCGLILALAACGGDTSSPFPVECGELPPWDFGEPSGILSEPPTGNPPFDAVIYRYNCVLDGQTFVEQRWRRDPKATCPEGEYGWIRDGVYSRENLNC